MEKLKSFKREAIVFASVLILTALCLQNCTETSGNGEEGGDGVRVGPNGHKIEQLPLQPIQFNHQSHYTYFGGKDYLEHFGGGEHREAGIERHLKVFEENRHKETAVGLHVHATGFESAHQERYIQMHKGFGESESNVTSKTCLECHVEFSTELMGTPRLDYCGKCHGPMNTYSEDPSKPALAKTPREAISSALNANCDDCHHNEASLPESVISRRAMCGSCHEGRQTMPNAQQRPAFVRQGLEEKGCQDCHGSWDVALKINPKIEGCANCHELADAPYIVQNPELRPCVSCHSDTLVYKEAGVPGVKLCDVCHDPETRLNEESDREDALKPYLIDGRRIPWIRPGSVYMHAYPSHRIHIVKSGIKCLDCHEGMVASTDPPTTFEQRDRKECIECHEEKEADVDCLSMCHQED
ncbi:MAG: cytochrome c3 family protein [Planctomycetes bacterium]|nr:cytochrome c3 family protein [Planctomycetota bacterium]